jgi:heme exporter protein D
MTAQPFDLQTFLEMGGYAAYVWPSYGLSFLALLAITWFSWRWMRRVERIAAAASTASRASADKPAQQPSEPVV